jgi:flagellar biosynthesis GTPase FlhF
LSPPCKIRRHGSDDEKGLRLAAGAGKIVEERKLGSMRIAALISPTRMRGLLGVLVVLVLSLVFATGCNFGSDQEQALEEQKQKNEELQKQLEEQKEKEARQKEKEEEARQEELEQQVKDLQEEVEEQEKEQQNQESDSSGDSSSDTSDEGIENSDTSPSQADEGIVVVSSDFNTAAATAEEAEVVNAAIEYYQYAEIGDYDTTYNLLSYEDQSYYTRDEWVASNTALDSAAGEFVVMDAYPDDLGLGVPTYAVTVTVYTPNGPFNRTTYFVNEGGYWAHYLSTEEVTMFDDALY